MKQLPIGKQNFKGIIEDDLLYVDKTRQVYDLINSGSLYFLSRPRRFGKSLLVSTFQRIFEGDKALFKNLYIGKETDYDWKSYPILQFSFNNFGYETKDLRGQLSRQLQKYAEDFGVNFEQNTLTEQFKVLIEDISAQDKPVVILIDEYDKPIVDFITDVKQAKVNQGVLKDFFSPLKDLERMGHIRFLFITGVSKFSKVSLFSDLNNLVDLSISPTAHDLTGITQTELLEYFPEYIKQAAQENNLSEEALLVGVKDWYNGYSFEGNTRLYNPFSLLNFFRNKEFGNFWFATGTPTFLVKTIRSRRIDPKELESITVPSTFFDKFSIEDLDMAGLLFQTGYLTIKKKITRNLRKIYTLGYPNQEVRHSFIYNLLEAFTYQSTSVVGQVLIRMEEALMDGNLDIFINQLKILLSDLSYFHQPPTKKNPTITDDVQNFAMWEGYFHTIIYLVMGFIGLEVKSEISKHQGRLDLIAESENYLYLMEFKLDDSAENAIQQIKDREYAAAYLNTPKTLILVGIGFSKEERSVKDWKSEIWKREGQREDK